MTLDSLSIDRTALEQLANLLLERAGLKITPDGYYGLRLALQARMPALGLDDAQEYVRRLKQLAGEHELRALLPLVTVGKTEFFRDTRQFGAFEQEVFPRVLATARDQQRQVQLWSAGCATGEEPYSLAMVAVEKGATPAEASIWATDLNPAAVESASLARFPARRLLGLSDERVERHFVPVDAANYEVRPEVRGRVRFEPHNLAAPVWPQVQPQSLDVIFCRNVIIYFDQPTIIGVMSRFYDALKPGGWLFLGYSESLFKITTRFEMVEVAGTFLYRRPVVEKTAGPMLPSPPVRKAEPPKPPPKPLPPKPKPVAPFVAAPPLEAGPKERPAAPAHRTPVERHDAVVAAMEAGDFPRALRGAKALVDDHPEDLAGRLTLGNVHALMGNLDEARECFAAALTQEPLCVEARLYLAMAELQVGHLDEAKVELTRALFLEPTLILGHYLLGQVHERRGDAEAARRSYKNAVAQQKALPHPLVGHFPDLPRTNDAIAQAAKFRVAALSEA